MEISIDTRQHQFLQINFQTRSNLKGFDYELEILEVVSVIDGEEQYIIRKEKMGNMNRAASWRESLNHPFSLSILNKAREEIHG